MRPASILNFEPSKDGSWATYELLSLKNYDYGLGKWADYEEANVQMRL